MTVSLILQVCVCINYKCMCVGMCIYYVTLLPPPVLVSSQDRHLVSNIVSIYSWGLQFLTGLVSGGLESNVVYPPTPEAG